MKKQPCDWHKLPAGVDTMAPQCGKPWLRCRRSQRCQEFMQGRELLQPFTSKERLLHIQGLPCSCCSAHGIAWHGRARPAWLGSALKWKRCLCEFKTGDNPGLAWQRELLPEWAHSWVQLRRRDSGRIVFPTGRWRESERAREGPNEGWSSGLIYMQTHIGAVTYILHIACHGRFCFCRFCPICFASGPTKHGLAEWRVQSREGAMRIK